MRIGGLVNTSHFRRCSPLRKSTHSGKSPWGKACQLVCSWTLATVGFSRKERSGPQNRRNSFWPGRSRALNSEPANLFCIGKRFDLFQILTVEDHLVVPPPRTGCFDQKQRIFFDHNSPDLRGLSDLPLALGTYKGAPRTQHWKS